MPCPRRTNGVPGCRLACARIERVVGRSDTAPIVGSGDHRYRWLEPWVTVPEPELAAVGWAEHDIAITAKQTVLACHPTRALLLELDAAGELLRTDELPLTECHGLTTVCDGGQEYVWVADVGAKCDYRRGYEEIRAAAGPRVVKLDGERRVVQRVSQPPHSAYRAGGAYVPTSLVVFDHPLGGNGELWLADGYGSNLVHRLDPTGSPVGTLTGEEGAGHAFECPHTLWINPGDDPELWITDRKHDRIQVYDLEGAFKRTVGDGFLIRPTGLAKLGDEVAVIELFGRLTILDAEDAVVCRIGDNVEVQKTPGWPNELDDAGRQRRTSLLRPGKLNSPHGIGVDAGGSIYLSEWLIGGRYIKLEPID